MMKLYNRLKSSSVVGVLLVLFLTGSAIPVWGQDKDEQIEQLKNQIRKLQQKVREIEKDQEQEVEQIKKQQEEKQDRIEFLEKTVKKKAEQIKGQDRGGLLPEQPEWKPGWERAKSDMQPGRRELFNLRLGRVGDLDVYMGVDTVGRFQALNNSDAYSGGTEQGDLDPDFQQSLGDMNFLATFNDDRENKDPYLEVYFDWHISSRHHPDMFGDEGYMMLSRLPEGPDFLQGIMNHVDLKAGEYELPYGDQIYRRTSNATAQRNPLIGNSVVDARATELGVAVMNDSPSSKPGKINWMLNVTSGDPTPSHNSGAGLGILPKVWMNLTENLRVSVSGYDLDQGTNGPGFPVGGDSSNLLTGLRDTGGIYEAVLGGGNDSGQVLFQGGQEPTAVQGDVTYRTDSVELYGHLGYYKDNNINGSVAGHPEERWLYGTLEGVYRFTDRLYAAARYSTALAEEVQQGTTNNSVGSSGRVDRFQIGGGYWLTDTILFKVEGVHQTFNGFDSTERQVSGVDAWRDPSFSGVISEFSWSF